MLDKAQDTHTRICGSLHSQHPLIGLARAHHRNRRGAPISFRDKPYLIPLYAQLPQMERADFCKAVQTGLSELLIQLMLHKAGWEDRIVAYVLPTYMISARFVAERIDPLLQEVPAYVARTPGGEEGSNARSKGSLSRKRFGRRGSLLFLGSNSDANFVEFTADTMIVDELDECDPTNVARVLDRLRESDHPQLIRVSNPGIAGAGIHKAWKEGSRARYFHVCAHCNERQPLDWQTHFVRRLSDGTWIPRDTARATDSSRGDLRPVCRRCREPWELTGRGCWVAEFPSKSPSFHMSRLDILPNISALQPIRGYFAEWVKAQLSTTDLYAFWRGVLGWPYEGGGQRVTSEMLESCMENEPTNDLFPDKAQYADRTFVMGVDVGSVLNVVIDELEKADTPSGYRRRARSVLAVAEFEDLHPLIRDFGVQVCVIDAMPETRKAKELRDYYQDEGGCVVWLCRFHPQPRVGREAFGLKLEYSEHVITVDRTQLLDATLDELRTRQRTLPCDVNTVAGFFDQMKAPSRKLDLASQRYIWDEGNDPDHYRFADAYARVAQEVYDRMGGLYEV